MQAGLAPLAETDEELVCRLWVEEVMEEEAHQGRDAANLEMVMEAARPITRNQLAGLGAPTGQAVATI